MRALNTAGTGMIAQQYNLDVISHNLANVNTTGFKSERAEFQDLVYENFRTAGAQTGKAFAAPTSLQIGLGSVFSASSPSMTQGSLSQTGNPLDAAIFGDGFFKVQRPDGTFGFTRDGSFKTASDGKLVTSDGYPVDPPITVDSTYTSVNISSDGTVTGVKAGATETTTIGQLKIYQFTNAAGLNRIGQNLYTQTSASGNAEEKTAGDPGVGMIRGGYLEASNVSVVEEMVKMISAQRAYEINSKAIQTADDMMNVVNQLKR